MIPLHSNTSRAAAARRASQRAEAARRHPSLLSDPGATASAEEIAAVVREIDHLRADATGSATAEEAPNELAQRIGAVADFLRKRLTGDYSVDEFGFDPQFNNAVVLPMLRVFFENWFRVEVSGVENLPTEGAALVVANHAGTLPFDGLMLSVAVHDHHPANRDLRLLAADMVFDMPFLGPIARKAGHTMASTVDAHRLLAGGELTAVFPRDTRASASTSATATSCSGSAVVVRLGGAAHQGPDRAVLDRRVRGDLSDGGRRQAAGPRAGPAVLPDHAAVSVGGPGRAGAAAVQWHIAFGTPIETASYDESAADDPMVTFDLTDQVRETIQQTLYQLLTQRRNTFLG